MKVKQLQGHLIKSNEGGIFFGLYDHSPAAHGVEVYPDCIRSHCGVVINMSQSLAALQLPKLAAHLWYSIQFDDGAIEHVTANDMPAYIPLEISSPEPLVVPAWVVNNHLVTFLHLGEYHKGYLSQSDYNTWQFVCW